MRNNILPYLIPFIHALLTVYLIVSALLVFVPHFYNAHQLAHLVWTLAVIVTLLTQMVYRDCPLTIIEKKQLAKTDKNIENTYGKSFIVYWVHKLTGIQVPLWVVHAGRYPLFLIVILSWVF